MSRYLNPATISFDQNLNIMKKSVLIILLLFTAQFLYAQNSATEEYTLVTYNIENLFDADGVAIFDDYKPADNEGNPLYTKEDVLTKIQNAIRVLKEYNDGKGPDIIAMVELESDFTPGDNPSPKEFLEVYKETALENMLGDGFNETIADLPSHLLMLKGMTDAGMWEYNLEVGKSELDSEGEPQTVQKTVTYSRFPINQEKTKIHPLHRARPILETWLNVNGNELVVFNNHWKSGASSAEMENIRIQNAEVLRSRLEELLGDNPNLDIILAGDFNSDYNQKHRYQFEKTAVNDVLGSTGDEQKVAEGTTDYVFNLWYDYPMYKRGSDTYRGLWGTLMQIMITSGMYDSEGLQYVDNSIEVGDFGFNTYSTSGQPKRWSSAFAGSGYSDHLPVSMKFKVADNNTTFSDFSENNDMEWRAIQIQYHLPKEYYSEEEFTAGDPRENPTFYDEYVNATATVTTDYDFIVDGVQYDVYAPTFRLNEVLSEVAGTDTKINFYGRFSQFRGHWQFIIEDICFLTVSCDELED